MEKTLLNEQLRVVPQFVERKQTQMMLRNRLSTLLDIIKYLCQMVRDNGTGQMRTLATR